jgi:hypothetical protein
MEIKGRECEEVKIGEHTYYFLKEFKGKEFRLIQGVIYDEGVDIKAKSFMANVPALFNILCLEVKDVDGSLGYDDFLDNLSMEDYGKVQNKVIEVVTDFFTQIK